MANCHFRWFVQLLCLVQCCTFAHGISRTCILYALTSKTQEVIPAFNLAAEYFNNNNHSQFKNKLPCEIKIQLLNCNSLKDVTEHTLDIIQNYESLIISNTSIEIPIILGGDRSTYSVEACGNLNPRWRGLFSPASTSVVLSDIQTYPYFYRTIPADSLQSIGIIELCHKFNWTKIGIIYHNEDYGSHLASDIIKLGKESNIRSYRASYETNSREDITGAITSLKEQDDIFIIVLISHGSDLKNVFDILNAHSLFGYPRYYIGVDAWIDSPEVYNQHIEQITEGFIGTVPLQLNKLNADYYEGDLKAIYNKSLYFQNILEHMWFKNPALTYNQSIIGAKAPYAWDIILTIYHIVQLFDTKYSLENLFNGSFNAKKAMNIFNDLILNHNDIDGASGTLGWDQHGDRKNGLYGFGNLLEDSTVQYFGLFTRFQNGSVYSKIDNESIVWPIYFREKNAIPRSEPFKSIQIHGIKFWWIIIFSMIHFCIFVLGCIRMKNAKGKNSLYFTNFGLILCVIDSILYGMQNCDKFIENLDVTVYNVGCNVHIWFMSLIFTLLILPLFTHEYMIKQQRKTETMCSKRFEQWTIMKQIREQNIIRRIFMILIGDVLILMTVSLIQIQIALFSLRLLSFESGTDDELLINVDKYPICRSEESFAIECVTYAAILLYKLLSVHSMIFQYQTLKVVGTVCLPAMIGILISFFRYFNYITNDIHYIIVSFIVILINLGCIWTTWKSTNKFFVTDTTGGNDNKSKSNNTTITESVGETPMTFPFDHPTTSAAANKLMGSFGTVTAEQNEDNNVNNKTSQVTNDVLQQKQQQQQHLAENNHTESNQNNNSIKINSNNDKVEIDDEEDAQPMDMS